MVSGIRAEGPGIKNLFQLQAVCGSAERCLAIDAALQQRLNLRRSKSTFDAIYNRPDEETNHFIKKSTSLESNDRGMIACSFNICPENGADGVPLGILPIVPVRGKRAKVVCAFKKSRRIHKCIAQVESTTMPGQTSEKGRQGFASFNAVAIAFSFGRKTGVKIRVHHIAVKDSDRGWKLCVQRLAPLG